MNQIYPMASAAQKHMYKSWIRENPEIAMISAYNFMNEAKQLGMKVRYYEDEHYVDIVAALDEKDLDVRYI